MRKETQHDLIMSVLRPNEWIPLTSILRLGIAQYNTRIKELRDGDVEKYGICNIENKTKFINGTRHSWFRLVVHKPIPQDLFQTV